MGAGADPIIEVDPLNGGQRLNVKPQQIEASEGIARLGKPFDKKALPTHDPFNSSIPDQLANTSWEDVVNDRVPDYSTDANDKSGINPSYWLTHEESGHRFLIKRESYDPAWHDEDQAAERAANEEWFSDFAKSAGLKTPSTRQSDVDPTMTVLYHVNDEYGTMLLGSYWQELDFQEVPSNSRNLQAIIDALNLRDPSEIMRMSIFDFLINNGDRHGENWLISEGPDGKNEINPIDHGLQYDKNVYGLEAYFAENFGSGPVALTLHLLQTLGEARFRQIAQEVVEAMDRKRGDAPDHLDIWDEYDNFDSVDEIVDHIVEKLMETQL